MTLLSSFIFINFNYKINYKKTQKIIIFKSHKNQKFKNKLMFLKIILKNMSHKKTKNIYKKFVFIKSIFI